MTAIGYNQQSFKLPPNQSYSQSAGGSVWPESSTSAIWTCKYGTVPKKNVDIVTFEAILRSLNGMMNKFEAWDLRRPYPKAYANGVFSDSGTIHTIGSDNKSMRLQSLPANFALNVGDYFSFDYEPVTGVTARALHQITEAVTADGSGTTALFEFTPHLRDGVTTGTAVRFKRPAALFTLMPSNFEPSVEDVLHGSVTFEGIQYIP